MIDLDWAEAWRNAQLEKASYNGIEFWNSRASSYSKSASHSSYNARFLELAQIKPGETVLDMGCGTGALAIPLAQNGHHVYSCDFSPAMLDELMKEASSHGLCDLIHPVLLAWEDDWSQSEVPVCDVAIASRSIATLDLKDSLRKLDEHARRRACITMSTGASPRIDPVLLTAIGRTQPQYPDCVFGFNILWQMGIHPYVDYIESYRPDEFDSFDEAIEKGYDAMGTTPEEREKLIAYAKKHLLEIMGKDGVAHWEYDHARITTWTFLAWEK